MQRVLIINGHRNKEIFTTALTEAYHKGSLSIENEVEIIHLFDLNFNLTLRNGFNKNIELEPDLIYAQRKISWASQILIIHPVWWGSIPALLKGFFDRTISTGFALKYKENSLYALNY
ncbi:MAG: NAD(P)H-dependent oxidoreductase [Bacteroidota bacterium]|jgi:putative NADPH-quinone reductase